MWHYVGKIGQRLKEQINQYIPTNVHNLHQCVNTPDSAIAGHFLKKNSKCAQSYNQDRHIINTEEG